MLHLSNKKGFKMSKKKYIKSIISLFLSVCLFYNSSLIAFANKDNTDRTIKYNKQFDYTSLEHAVFINKETEQEAINQMSSKDFSYYLYVEAVNFFCSTKIGLNWSNILCIGDSLTLGVQTGVEEPYPNSYPEIIGNLFHAQVENAGIGGSTIWGSGPYAMCKRIGNYGPADAVFILGGLNDWSYGEQCILGDLDSPITFTYDFNWLCEELNEHYPNAEIFIIIPMNPCEYIGIEDEPYYEFDDIRNIERSIAADYGFHIIDLPGKNILSGLDPETKASYYSDSYHLNTMGYEMLGKIVAYEAIRAMYENS